MKHKFENNKHNKDGPKEENNYPVLSIISENNSGSYSVVKQGFVAWPEKTLAIKPKNDDVEILEGRTRGGGYVAYPKKKSASIHTENRF